MGGWHRAKLCDTQTGLISGEPITLKKLGSAIGAAGQEWQPSARKMAFVGGHDQRQCSTLKRRAALCASPRSQL
jgi:hypothetical protein